jgi:4-hydroxyphenylpyruvate dioxygenase
VGEDFYAHVMGFRLYQHFDDKDISTEYSALMSKVMANGNGYVKFPINEPAEGKRKVADRGVSRLLPAAPACSTSRWPPTTFSTRFRGCSEQGVEFPDACRTPTTPSCKSAWERSTSPSTSWSDWASWSIATTKATCCRSSRAPWKTGPTLFYEIIQRKGSRSFGKGNFKALFEAIEREQDAAGKPLMEELWR